MHEEDCIVDTINWIKRKKHNGIEKSPEATGEYTYSTKFKDNLAKVLLDKKE